MMKIEQNEFKKNGATGAQPPRAPPKLHEGPALAREAARRPDTGKVNILAVDDRPDKLLALEAVLSVLGENIVTAKSGKEALKLLLKQDFAVILLDVSMPVMDGFETAEMIRRRPSSELTPIIFVTSLNTADNQITKGYSLGAVDYIISPIVPAVLQSKVSVFVELFKKTEQVRQQAEQLRLVEEAEHRRKLSEAVDRLEMETRRNRFFTLAVDMLAIANFDGYLLQLNPTWQQTLGYSEAELKAQPMLDFAHPDDRPAMNRELLQLKGGAPTTYFETRYRHKDGSYRWLGWTAAPFVAERLFYIFARDITDRKWAEEKINHLNVELQQRVAELVEINSELEAFNYSISHDLRAPVRAMQGFARALIEDEGTRLGEDGRNYAGRIINAGSYMDRLLHDLLDYSRLTRAELELMPVNLEDAVNEVSALISREIQDRHARIEVQRPLEFVLAHPATLSQILANLMGNAVKFVDPSQQPVVRIWAEARSNVVRLYVQDNGIGIDPAHHKKIFGLFERLHGNSTYPGTGIGLAIVRKGIERMSGNVGVESAKGAGSRFWIELPKASSNL